MSPAWKLGSLFLGVVTTRLGSNYVYACTEAVEEVIVQHYKKQIKYLDKSKANESLKRKIKQFCEEEDNHRMNADKSVKSDDMGLRVFKAITKRITRFAIKVSKKV